MGEHTLFALDQIPPEMMWPEPHLQRSKPGTSRQKHQNPKCLEVLNAGHSVLIWYCQPDQFQLWVSNHIKRWVCVMARTQPGNRGMLLISFPPPLAQGLACPNDPWSDALHITLVQ